MCLLSQKYTTLLSTQCSGRTSSWSLISLSAWLVEEHVKHHICDVSVLAAELTEYGVSCESR